MRSQRMLRLAAPVLVGALALTGCGSKKEKGTSGGSNAKTVKIGFIAPLSGSLSALGTGMKNSVDLAVTQANKANKIPGWTIQFSPEDDQADANTGAQAASKLSSDSQVVGVVGTLNSSVALQVAPILQRSRIVQISPANTNPELTQGKNYLTSKKRQFDTYFRVCTTDAVQGPFAADYAYNDLHMRKVFLANDKKVYGQGLAAQFETEWKKLGGQVVGHEVVTDGQKDFGAVVSKVKAAKPDLLYYGGEYPEAAPLSKQMKDGGVKVPLMGGDGIVDKTYSKTGGPEVEGDYATNVGAAVEDLPSAKSFVDAYQAAGYKDPYSAYGPLAYDAANVIIQAVATALNGKSAIDDSVRSAIISSVQATNYQGVTGAVSFDQYGDTTNRVLTMYKLVNGDFKKQKTEKFNG